MSAADQQALDLPDETRARTEPDAHPGDGRGAGEHGR